MKLMIVTQVVDKTDPILGFFHRWIEEFAKQAEQVTVICLYEGSHQLPKNVRVLSLGKEKGTSRLKYLRRFFSYIRIEKKNYDAVFVHMNPEYAVLGGLLWRFWGKKIVLWYVHKSVNLRLWFATLLAHNVFTASKESFRIKNRKVRVLGHGIDMEFFKPDSNVARGQHLLSVGRLNKAKRHDLAIETARYAQKELRVAGEGSEKESLQVLANKLGAQVVFLGALTQERLRDEYRKAAHLIHTSETGSLDKVVLEALACNCEVITTDRGLSRILPVKVSDPTPQAIAQIILKGGGDSIDYSISVREKHSLPNLVGKIFSFLSSK